MLGKAHMLLAKRSLSALVVVCLVVSAFAGFLFLTDSAPTEAQAIGDLIVVGGTYTIENIVQPIDGNVIVGAGGHLIIRDGTLSVISNNAPGQMHNITVSAGGTITLEHGTITTYLDQINPYPFLSVNVNSGRIDASNNSVLQFPGQIVLTAGAQVTLNDTLVTKLDDGYLSTYLTGSVISLDEANDGPAISVTDSTLRIFDATIDAIPEYPDFHAIASNITLAGSSTLLAVNSYIGVDFDPADLAYSHNALVVSGLSHAYLYGCRFEEYVGDDADRSPAIVASGSNTSPATPLTKGGADNTGESLTNLAALDGLTYQVRATETMEIETWDAGTLSDALLVSSATLIVTYSPATNYAGTNPIRWTVEGGSYVTTGIVPVASDPAGTTKMYDFPLVTVQTVGHIRNLDLLFINNGAGGTGSANFDRIWIVFTVGADAFVYRWLNATVGDEYGVPIPDATITAKYTGITDLEGQEAMYFSPRGISNTPPAEVLSYMGVTAGTYRLTKSDGIAVVPYLTDMITNGASANPVFVGSYAITGSATILGTPHSSTSNFSFRAYPAMEAADRSFDHTVKLNGVSAQSPNPARWLVVPPNPPTVLSLTIEDMTYYHAGDVIVAANGTLILDHAVFQLVQSQAYERTVFIDGTASAKGKMIIRNSVVISGFPIKFIVKGFGELEVTDSVLEGIEIVAMDDSSIVFHNVSMDSLLMTEWDARSKINIYDSDLAQTPVLSGSSVVGFTDANVPSISVQRNAQAIIYRWIHVTVYDGAGYPLQGANVTAKYFISGIPASWAMSDENGVALVNSEGTRITATGSTFVGNYKVGAVLHAGVDYWSENPGNVSIGVMPYTEPLTSNTTYMTLTIPKALPDLTLPADPLSANPSNPPNRYNTTITVNVTNVGPVAAHDVNANFYDESGATYIGTGSVPVILPGDTGKISVSWIASSPLAPDFHNITVKVDEFNTTPELVETSLTAYTHVFVQRLPDVQVLSTFDYISTQPSPAVVNQTVSLRATVFNYGDATVTSVSVQFFDQPETGGSLLVGTAILTGIEPGGGYAIASVPWTPYPSGLHMITVAANGGSGGSHAFTELTYDNNEATKGISVLTPPDLELTSLAFSPGDRIPGGDTLTITARLRNTQQAPVSNPFVVLRLGSDTGPAVGNYTAMTTLGSGDATTVMFTYVTPVVEASTPLTFYVIANPTGTAPEEITLSNNVLSGIVTVLDMRPNLVITAGNLYVQFDGSNATSSMFGRTVTVCALVDNSGGTYVGNFTAKLGIRNAGGYNNTFHIGYYNISANVTDHVRLIQFVWRVNISDAGPYDLYAWVDTEGAVFEQFENDNWANKSFTITQAVLTLTVSPDKAEYSAGDTMVIVIGIMYQGTSVFVPFVPNVVAYLWDVKNNVRVDLAQSDPVDATEAGVATAMLTIPSDLKTGSYKVIVEIWGQPHDVDAQVQISGEVKAGLFPMWVWILIIVLAVGIVAGFTVYTYKYGLGKYVECGECGAFIPADKKRCPKCGVEFEAGTMKCSECGAWIPAESTECPNCGVKFVGEVEAEGDYMERMQSEYDEMVSKYRELAKPELGKKFSEKEFEAWWRNQPGYITFEDWLAKEEEKKKEGPIPCPVCGTLNPKEATVCHKCGTVFGAVKGGAPPARKGPPPAAPPSAPQREAERPAEAVAPPEAAVPGAAPRMVIRRPIDRKVVPKKIIKTPLGTEEKKEGEESGDEENQ